MYNPEQRPSDLVKDQLPDVDAVDAPKATAVATRDEIIEAMKDVVDPELMVNVVDLGLLYGAQIDDEANVTLDMTLTSPACPLQDVITDQARGMLVNSGLCTDMEINWVWIPAWGPDKITDDGREQLRALGFTV